MGNGKIMELVAEYGMEVSTQKLNRILSNSRLFSVKNDVASSPEPDKK